MTQELEDYYKRFCKAVDRALTPHPEKEWYAVMGTSCIGKEAYDPDILLDCGDCGDSSSVRVYTDEDGHMVFKPQKKGGTSDAVGS